MGTSRPAWTEAVERFDEVVRPIAARPVSIADLASADGRHPIVGALAEAGIKDAAAALMAQILEEYARATAADRAQMRALFAAHQAFAWAAGFLMPFSADVAAARQQLLLFSLLDQGTDSRDALLWLRTFCGQPGVDCRVLPDLLREIAALSSAVDKYHMGSTASMLVSAASYF
jgi:hypothetical protein